MTNHNNRLNEDRKSYAAKKKNKDGGRVVKQQHSIFLNTEYELNNDKLAINSNLPISKAKQVQVDL